MLPRNETRSRAIIAKDPPPPWLSDCVENLFVHSILCRSQVACVGAVPWVVNYNLLLQRTEGSADTASVSADASASASDILAEAKRIARAVSERGGGLPKARVARKSEPATHSRTSQAFVILRALLYSAVCAKAWLIGGLRSLPIPPRRRCK